MTPNKTPHDFAVAYRIYPKISKVPPAFPKDKLALSELCLRSFVRSYGSLRPKFYAILDKCPPEYEQLFRKYVAKEDLEILHLTGVGNAETFGLQVKLLQKQNCSDVVYFAEDDYYYLPGVFQHMVQMVKTQPDCHFATPYDHKDYYSLEIHNNLREVRHVHGRHWQTVGTTCMTFMTTKAVLARTAEVLLTYAKGNTDVGMWSSLTKLRLDDFSNDKSARAQETLPYVMGAWQYCFQQVMTGERYKLWSPMPSLATHMENRFLSPGFDWEAIFQRDIAAAAVPPGESRNHSAL
jgi:hypothetical protein